MSLTEALEIAGAGDTISLADGLYREPIVTMNAVSIFFVYFSFRGRAGGRGGGLVLQQGGASGSNASGTDPNSRSTMVMLSILLCWVKLRTKYSTTHIPT